MCLMTFSLGSNLKVPQWSVADRVRKARETSGLKQAELAESIGMARTSLARIEQGKVEPRRTSLIAIAFATRVPLEWIEHGKTPADNPGGGSECAIRDSNPEPTDLCTLAA